MVNNIGEILQIRTEDQLRETLVRLDLELEDALKPLRDQLRSNVTSSDVYSQKQHMGYVESWRDTTARYLMLVSALCEHARSDAFSLVAAPGERGPTEKMRDSHERALSGGFKAWETRLEQILKSVDSRVNLCKKLLGIEEEGATNSRRMGV